MSPLPPDPIPPDLLDALLENPYESQILVDKDGIIRFLSVHAEEFYGVPRVKAIGSHVTVLNKETLLPRVLETGKAEIGRVLMMGGKERIVARIPLRDREGKIVGAVGKLMFWHIARLKEMFRQIEVLETRLDYYEKELQTLYTGRYALERMVGESPAIREAKRIAAQAASSDLSVLITGETGTGKEILAHAIHQMGPRARKPFVKVNCAAIPQDLFESELFGYEPGAFTGASHKGKPGKFELADGGTIFLDEIGDMPLPLQAKLLRVVQEREVERLGGTRTLSLDFRVVAATNRDLRGMIEKGTYRQDLFYRLNIFHIQTPPLREIQEDIPRIAYHILSEILKDRHNRLPRIAPEAMGRLTKYRWPGNVRELQNCLERAAAVSTDGSIQEAQLPVDLMEALPQKPSGQAATPMWPLKEALALEERRIIEETLLFTRGNRREAARLLGIHRTGLYQKLRIHGLGCRAGPA